MRLQAIKLRRPQLAIRLEPVIELFQRLGTDAIKTTLRIRANLDKTRVSQDPKMFGHGGLTEVEAFY
jgi:hypothetical protein